MLLACPRCRTALRTRSFKGVAVDRCTRCDGIWFDAGELSRAARVALPPVSDRDESTHPCPRCRDPMWKDRMGPVVARRCKGCAGVFLDGGAFRALRRGREPVGARRALDAHPPGPDAAEAAPAVMELVLLLVGVVLGD